RRKLTTGEPPPWRYHTKLSGKYKTAPSRLYRLDAQSCNGRGTKYFEFSEEMDNLFAYKKPVNPEILLVTETIYMPVEEEVVGLQDNMDPLQSCETVETVVRTPKRKLTIAEKMRCERKAYQEKRLKI
ncbi:hypothetical protein C0J52_11755, partial [Blattella germanica]